MTLSTALLLFSALNPTCSWAGGPHCASGYCLDGDGQGCHACDIRVEPIVAKPEGAICCSDAGVPVGTETHDCIPTC